MIQSLFLDVSHVVAIVIVLTVLLLARKGLRVVRLRPAMRERLDRLLPALETAAFVGFVLWCVWLLTPEDSEAFWWASGAIVLGLFGAGWFAVRDLVSGIILRSENAYTPGQWVETAQAAGFIASLGYRTMELETDAGLRIRLPYSQLGKAALTTADRSQSARAHTFILELPATESVAVLTSRIRSAALTAFWSSPRREPYVHYIEVKEHVHRFEVTTFCLDEAYATDLERSVRRQLEPH
ncbi:MAG: mechanosensitive ion channel [Rhodothermales bacterium]